MGLFKQKAEVHINRSKYFSDKLYANKLITIDSSANIFIRNSLIRIPPDLIVTNIGEIVINGDRFELTKFSNRDRLLYDAINDIFYFMRYHSNESSGENIKKDEIMIDCGDASYIYSACSEIMETDQNELYRIYNREISNDSDEYLFVILDSNMTEHYWLSVILQPSMIG